MAVFWFMEGDPVQSSSGLVIPPHGALRDQIGDVLVVMPSYGYLKPDTGSWLLARVGLLEDHRATTHWDELSRFEEAFPAGRVAL